MRKSIIFLFFLISVGYVQSQSKLGLKFSPTISANRISLIDSTYDVTTDGTGFKFSIGLIYDHELSDTYYFSTGLVLQPKRSAFGVVAEPESGVTYSGEPVEAYRLQYLQIPLTLKLFTNEVMPDGRVFFQVGTSLEFLVNDEPEDEDFLFVSEYKGFDMALIGGVGFEYRAGLNTTLFGAVTYQRGLNNSVGGTSLTLQDELFVRNTLVSLDLGIKF